MKRVASLVLVAAIGCAEDAEIRLFQGSGDATPTEGDVADASSTDVDAPSPLDAEDDAPPSPDVDDPEDVPDSADSDVTEPPDTDLADGEADEVSDAPDVPDPLDVPDVPEPGDADDVPDPDDVPAPNDIPDPDDVLEPDDVDEADTPPDPSDVPDTVEPPSPLVLGTLAGAAFTPLPDGVDLEITQGPQGGIHLEVGIDVAWDSTETKLSGVLSCRTRLGAADVGFNETPNFILYRAPEGTYRSVMIPVYFQEWDAGVYVDKNVAVSCSFTVGDEMMEDGAVVHLVDYF